MTFSVNDIMRVPVPMCDYPIIFIGNSTINSVSSKISNSLLLRKSRKSNTLATAQRGMRSVWNSNIQWTFKLLLIMMDSVSTRLYQFIYLFIYSASRLSTI